MIDDDFESVFRRMIEQFMEAFGEMPEGSFGFRTWNGSVVNGPIDTEVELNNNEPKVERIDLRDRALILIEWSEDIEIPTVKVTGSNVTVQPGPDRKEISVEVGFQISLEKSNVSHRNGVTEISVVKTESENTDDHDGFLKVE